MERIEYSMNEKDKNTGKNRLQKKAGKYLAIFIVAMIVLTIVSRISASLTVPLVSTQKARKDVLNYNIKGDGMIDSANAIYLEMVNNLQIEKVGVKKGQSVKKGDLLFQYSMEQLEEQIEKASADYETSSRAYEKAILTASLEKEKTDSSQEQKAVARATEDYKQAQEDYKKAKVVYKEKVEEIKKKLSDTQKEEYEKAQEEYDLAKEAYDDTKNTYENQVADAKEALATATETSNKEIQNAKDELVYAQSELDEVMLKKTTLTQYMKTFEQHAKNQKYNEMYTDLENIYKTYFGKNEYAEIKRKISDAQGSVEDAERNLKSVKAKWKLIMEEEDRELAKTDPSDPDYETALNKYKQQQLEQEKAIREASDAVDNAKKEVSRVSPKYTEISDAAIAYFNYLTANPSGNNSTLYKNYYVAIIDSSVVDESSYKIKNKAVEKAKTVVEETTKQQAKAVEKAKKAVDDVIAKKKKELKKAKALMAKKAKVIDDLLDKVYEDKDGMRTAREGLETKEDLVDTAKRALEDARDKLLDSQTSKIIKSQNDEINEKIQQLDLEQLQDDMKSKKETLDKLKQVLEENGEVSADIDGMVTALDIEPKTTISGSEKVAITPSCSVFIGNFDKDYMEYVQTGDKISCQLTGYKKAIEGEVIDIAYNGEGDCYTVTAKLPDEKFAPGITGHFTINKSSDKYDNCIPLTALRSDNSGDYVLVMRETNTVLGKEYEAYRINVIVQKKDFQTAVINEVLGYDDEVIIGSNRNVMEGDRVRKGTYE
jgi:multidrug resistance efflux pump